MQLETTYKIQFNVHFCHYHLNFIDEFQKDKILVQGKPIFFITPMFSLPFWSLESQIPWHPSNLLNLHETGLKICILNRIPDKS